MDSAFDKATRLVVQLLTRDQVEKVANWVAGNPHGSDVMGEVTVPFVREAISNVLASLNLNPLAIRLIAADHLRALADGYALGQSAQGIRVVWTGPDSEVFDASPVGNVFIGLINEAQSHLTFMTDSLDVHVTVADAFRAAVVRGVSVVAIADDRVELSQSSSAEPRVSLSAIPNLQVWRWAQPSRARARLAVVDGSVLLVSSAAITGGDSAENLDINVMIRGGAAPEFVSNQLKELQASGMLDR